MKKQNLKQYLRDSGCAIESHSQSETFLNAGDFILGQWYDTSFVVKSLDGGGIMLRVKQSAGWCAHSAPCRACSRFMGADAPDETISCSLRDERQFIWRRHFVT